MKLSVSNFASEKKNMVKNVQLILDTESQNILELAKQVLTTSFRCMEDGVWYRILPLDEEDTDDLAHAVGQTWDGLLPILLVLFFFEEERRFVGGMEEGMGAIEVVVQEGW